MKKANPTTDKTSGISGIDEPTEKHSDRVDGSHSAISKPDSEEVLAIMKDGCRILWETRKPNLEEEEGF